LFDEEGFLRMGDVGCWAENGAIKIVDRCKNMFKLSQGEYVAPERVEQIYMTSPLLNCVYVEGNPLHAFTVGVVVPNWTELHKRLQTGNQFSENGKPQPTTEELCENKEVKTVILQELNTVGRAKGLKGFELVIQFDLL
uniref:AMP-binding domain-containing protein n=1 Tax=Echinostoma caproni TaxID=27848 RepID=A0A183BBQ6_9TREM